MGRGVYCFGGAASVAGDLVLDAQNDPNGLFIFKINGALTSAATSRVVLVNGAAPANVWWQVGGATSLAAATTFAGTMLVYGAIDLGDGASLQGRALSTVGAISTYNNELVSPSAGPLPVVLTAFTAQAQGTTVRLAWHTASEQNSARFEVKRSSDAGAFRAIGTLLAAGSTPRRMPTPGPMPRSPRWPPPSFTACGR